MENKVKRKWSEKKGLPIVLLSAAGMALLAIVSWLFFDKYVLDWLTRNPEYFDNIFLIDAIVLLGKIWIPVWLILCWALLAGRRQEAMAALVAIILLAMVVPPLKGMIDRPRPRDIIANQNQGNGEIALYKCSFPSGDTASIFAIGAAIIPYIGWLEGCIVFVLAIVVGTLRVASSAHYPSDVFAGAAIGVLIGYAAYFMAEKISFFKNHLIKILSPIVILITIIMIPLIEGLFGRRKEIVFFLKFYLPAVIVLSVMFKIVKRK